MNHSITFEPQNSLILIMDHSYGEVPASMNGQLVSATASCVAMGTLSEVDGATKITLADSLLGIDVLGEIVFDGTIKAPQHEISVCSVANEKLLSIGVSSSTPRIKIFANHPVEPDQVVILVDS